MVQRVFSPGHQLRGLPVFNNPILGELVTLITKDEKTKMSLPFYFGMFTSTCGSYLKQVRPEYILKKQIIYQDNFNVQNVLTTDI
jgi:hypothetical protein